MESPWPRILVEASDALDRALGARVTLSDPAPMSDGWSAQHATYPGVRRCKLEGGGPATVVVKLRRAADGDALEREWAALALLADLGSHAGPCVLARGADFLVLEDLGRGPAVEDLLVGADPAAATDALVALAHTTGAMQALSLGHADAFYRRAPVDADADRTWLAGAPIAQHRATLTGILADAALPALHSADADLDAALTWLAGPAAPLALSSGDLAPQNCRLFDGAVRLLDFERAGYRHPLLDAAHLRLPFYSAPCWGRLPSTVTSAMESAFRTALASAWPAALDASTYVTGMAAATAAWAVARLVRLPALLARDEPHPMGFSRRGQLLDTLHTAIDAADHAHAFPSLRTWLADLTTALCRRWPGLPAAQALYPAFDAAFS